MKKNILILCYILSCTLGWAQTSPPVERPKAKQPVPAVMVARLQDQEEKSLQVYPNPSNGIVHLTLAGFKGKKTDLLIINVIGNVVHREVLNEVNDRYTKTIDLSRYANGLYYVKLQSDDFSEIRKVIIN